MAHIFSVRELTASLRDTVESRFPFVWVRGQVTGIHRSAAGHMYFGLKDGQDLLKVVWFAGNQNVVEPGQPHPLTGEVAEDGRPFRLEEGMEVLCAGRITVYGPQGTYQLSAELVQEVGVGRLHVAFEALKADLAGRGWFDAERKRPLPRCPSRVALVTSDRGAAVRDFLRIAGPRGLGAEIRLHPVLVQGEKAAPMIAEAVAEAGRQGWAQVVVLVRGGGSIEDLWAFNTMDVARAVHDSSVPVLTGVGHEIDTTIADLVADLRAATPSHAAQILWPGREEYAQRLDDAARDLDRAFAAHLGRLETQVDQAARALSWFSPAQRLARLDKDFSREAARLVGAGRRFLESREGRLHEAARRLAQSHGPRRVDGVVRRVEQAADRLHAAVFRRLERAEHDLEVGSLRLAAVDPLAPLQRGYALVRLEATGELLTDPAGAGDGDPLDIRLARGGLKATTRKEETT